MGGFGSGRYHWYIKKTIVEDCYQISVREYKLSLAPSCMGVNSLRKSDGASKLISYRMEGDPVIAMRITFTATTNGAWQELSYQISLTTTLTYWGSRRYWFICPLEGCGRRVGVLHLPPGFKYFIKIL